MPVRGSTHKQYTAPFFLVFIFLSFFAKAQFYNLPNDYNFSLLTAKQLAAKDSSVHAGLQPYVHFFSKKYQHVADSHRIFKFIKDDPALDLFFYKHLLRVEPKKENFKLRLDPLFNFEQGRDFSHYEHGYFFTNTRGLIGSGYVGDKVYFETLFAENQSSFPLYLYNYVNSSQIVPGQGRWKSFRTNSFDYAFSSGMVSIQALKNLNIQVGHGKQKIGNGYRSLLLSDNAFNYPYLRLTQQWFKGRVQYTNIYAVLMNLVPASKYINPNTERLFQKKAASFQYLSANLGKSINLGFFQGLIWQAGDDHNRQHLEWRYFNPVIYSNLLSYGLDNKNNIITGLDLKIKLSNKINVYSQWMLDKVKSDSVNGRWGYQAGINHYDLFGVKNLFAQLEYNYVEPGSYGSPAGSLSDQSYFHYKQPLAYTPGYGKELMLMLDYKFKRIFVNLRQYYQEIPQANSGINYTSYVHMFHARIGYLINPSYNLNVCAGVLYRKQNFSIFNTLNTETTYIYIGLRTSLYNLYYDF